MNVSYRRSNVDTINSIKMNVSQLKKSDTVLNRIVTIIALAVPTAFEAKPRIPKDWVGKLQIGSQNIF